MSKTDPNQVLLRADNIGLSVDGRWLWRDLSWEILSGQRYAITGVSGSGKSSLLHAMAGLSSVSEGSVAYQGRVYTSFSDQELAHVRCHDLAFVYQQPYWLRDLTVLENVAVPLMLQGKSRFEALALADEELNRYAMGSHGHKTCQLLSGGERQRMCLARASVIKPTIIFADEPTGNLDPSNTEHIMHYLSQLTDKQTLVIATHEHGLLGYYNQVLSLDAII